MRAAHRELSHGVDDRPPRAQEIAERTGLTEKEVRASMEAMGSFTPLSLDVPARTGARGGQLSRSPRCAAGTMCIALAGDRGAVGGYGSPGGLRGSGRRVTDQRRRPSQ
ncbi:sigma-70 domain-containing protein [Streptomyces sp. OE57]|uniref:sigma-70 domain-containing protein n=1 Tax=Streptomyces lacaronensis TaxID=3379885 RepID=UPI0039B75841